MKFPELNKYFSGLALPLSSLRSNKSCGIGEFPDLCILADWCHKTGIDVIQILPVQSTGENNSPYSSDAAFALNPVYLRPELVYGASSFKFDIKSFSEQTESSDRVDYASVYKFKIALFMKIYEMYMDDIQKNREINNWARDKEWVNIYSAFQVLKKKNKKLPWSDWRAEEQNPDAQFIETVVKENHNETFFYKWIQYEAEKQLLSAAEYLHTKQVFLKGDLPILMDKDSCDVWYYRKYFDLENNAGAPPDMFSAEGQNWGFPVYHWDVLKQDNYAWWNSRLQQADRFFHAIRLDHVIGFLRIWKIATQEATAANGYFSPSAFIVKEDLTRRGFTELDITRLSQPSVSDLSASENTKQNNIENFHDKALLEVEAGRYRPYWFYYSSRSFSELPEAKQNDMHALVREYYLESEKIWEEHGREILSQFKKQGSYLYCAEDLGTIPDCMHSILESLGILSLRVGRWTRRYNEENAPFILPEEYPFLSVATTSVHDSSTLRGWCLSEHGEDSNAFRALEARIFECGSDQEESNYDTDSPELYKRILKWYFNSNSVLCVIPMQDLFSINKTYRKDNVEEERINVPGELNSSNWTYRMPCTLESLMEDSSFNEEVLDLFLIRRNKKIKN